MRNPKPYINGAGAQKPKTRRGVTGAKTRPKPLSGVGARETLNGVGGCETQNPERSSWRNTLNGVGGCETRNFKPGVGGCDTQQL